MNEERMPVNLYTLDVDGGREMTEEELKKQKKHDVQPWIFLICMSMFFGVILTYISTKGISDMLGILAGFFVLLILLIASSAYKIVKIMKIG